MSKIWKLSSIFVLIIGILMPISAKAATTNYVTANRTVTPSPLFSDEEAEVTLNITGTPPVNVVKPNDVVLILDKSGSMQTDNRFNSMIDASKNFVDLIDFTKHQVGVVDFSSTTSTFGLNTDAAAVKNYINSVRIGGSTNTAEAINQAVNLLANHRPDAQPVIVLLTDGQADSYDAAKQAALAAKDAGIVFYTIALLGPNEDPTTSPPNLLLGELATTEQHHHFVLGSVGLAEVYEAIVEEIGLASAYNVEITETVSPQFEIVPGSYNSSIPQPTVTGNTLKWHIQELKNDTLQLKYKIRLKQGQRVGTFDVANNTTITYKDFAGSNRTYTITNSNLEVKYHAPKITDITPSKGIVQGGESVTINGEYFRSGVRVFFGSVEASNVIVNNDKSITVTTPPGVQGKTIVKVTNDDYQSSTGDFSYYATPEVTSLSKTSGPYLGGDYLFINGNYFMPGAIVKFGTNDAIVSYRNKNQLLVTVPPASAEGLTDIYIENPDGTNVTVSQAYSYDPPIKTDVKLVSVQPNEGPLSGGTLVYLDGENIDPKVKIYFGTKEVTLDTFYSNKRIRVYSPSNTAGEFVDVTLENPDGTRSTLSNGFKYIEPPKAKAPVITGINPNQGYLAGGDIVYIDGENFVNGITAKIGNVNATVLNYYSANRIRILIPASTQLGSFDLTLTNPDGQSVSMASAYTYIEPPKPPAPTITTITPNSGSKLGGELVFIEGTGFVSGLNVKVNGTNATVLNYYGATKIRIQIPASTVLGNVDVVLTNPDGQAVTVSNGYSYTAVQPTITAISPNNGPLAGGDIVYIDGTNFIQGLTVTVGGKNAPILNYYSSSRIRIQIPAGNMVGSAEVVLSNPDGNNARTTYTYNAPPLKPAATISKLTLSTGAALPSPVIGGTVVYFEGTNFDPAAKVDAGGTLVSVLNYYSSGKFRIILPSNLPAGPLSLKVVNPDGQVSNIVIVDYKPN